MAHRQHVSLAVSRCPSCTYQLDAAMSHGMHAKPAPGDITICIQCQSILVFGDNLKPRWPTEAEMLDIAGRRDIVMAQRALFQAKRDKGLTK